jgi:hypothetical protein
MRIDKSRKNGRFTEIMNFVTVGRHLIGRNNSPDPLSFHKYGRVADCIGSDHTASDEGTQTQNSSLEDAQRQRVSRSLRFYNAHCSKIKTTIYEALSPAYTRFSAKAAAKESMSTDLRVSGSLAPAYPDVNHR